ncbi:Probable sulfate transporter 3.4 [Linum grandiflorum]
MRGMRVEDETAGSRPEMAVIINTSGDGDEQVHRVCLPPKRSTAQKLKQRLGEIFFPDDPLYRFKNQTLYNKLILGLQFLVPVFEWGPHYTLDLFKSDLVSGLTIASLAIPQGISYAKLAKLPPIIGLYSSFVPPLIYSALGSSKHLAVGPVSIASLVMGSMLSQEVSPANDPTLYLKLALTSTFFAGMFQACLGVLRLGFVIDFLSKATLVGFTAGAAVVVSLQQLKGLLGIVSFTSKMQIVPVISSVFHNRDQWSGPTGVMGLVFLVILLSTRHISMKNPKLFWVSAAAPLTSVVAATLASFIFSSKLHGVKIIGDLPKGLNPPSVNMLLFSSSHLALAIKTGLVTGILSLTEGIAVGTTFASLGNYQVDGNKEMMAIGAMNMVGSCTSCYVTTGSFSRSAVNYNAGAKTAVSNVVMASAVLVTLLFLMPLFHYTPEVILAAIIITAVIGLIDYKAASKVWKVDKLDFVACLCSFVGVILISVPTGLSVAVGVSMFKVLLHVTRPNTVMMGNIPGTQIYQSLHRYREAERVPSFLIISIESPIYFANCTYLKERIMRCIREEEDRISVKNKEEGEEAPLKYIILDMTAVSAIDTSGIEFVSELRKTLQSRSLKLVMANPGGTVMEKLHISKALEHFGTDGLFIAVGEAISHISSLSKTHREVI